MAQKISRAGWIRILVISVFGLAILPFTPGGRAYWRLHLAEVHADKLRPILQSDTRFQHVRLVSDLGMGGALIMRGEVANETDKEALTKLATDSKPPVKVWFFVRTPAQNTAVTHDGPITQ